MITQNSEASDVPDPVADDAPEPEEVGDTVSVPGSALYDVVAYTSDGLVYCTECTAEDYARKAREEPREIPAGGVVDRGAEWDCPGPACDHCHRRITSVSILHYGGVCQPRTCPEIEPE
jgi:hypothetical protein